MEADTCTDENLELRCQFDVLSRPDGSVFYCEGETAVLAGVYGPVECKMSKLLNDKAYIEMNYRPKSGLPCITDRFYESIIKNTCETSIAAAIYPRASVVVTIQEMHDNGQLLSCAINAACLACLNSGIGLRFLFASTTCYLTNDDNIHFIAPMSKDTIQAIFVFVFDSMKGNVIVSHTEGSFSAENYKKALQKCRVGSKRIFKFIQSQVVSGIEIKNED